MCIFDKLSRWYLSRRALPYWSVLIADMLICYLSGILVFWFYYRGAVTLGNLVPLTKTIAIYMVFNLVGFRIFHTYSGIIRYSSFVDLQRVGLAQIVSCFCAEVFHYIVYNADLSFIRLEGRQILLMYVIATVLMWMMRVVVKTIYDVSFGDHADKLTLVYGSDASAAALAKTIRNDKSSNYRLNGFVSNDPRTRTRLLLGVHIYSDDESVEKVIKRHGVEVMLVPSKLANSFRNDQKLIDILINEKVKIYIVPGPREWTDAENVSLGNLKEINISDLLPRDEIQVDMESIGKMLTGRNVMITGSAGSIGSEMVRQIAVYKPSNMILIDQAETPQHDIRLMMKREHPDINCETIVVSITQKNRMEHIFKTYHPDYVFHAAAYKHVPMMEDNPNEAVYNNVYGTKIIADLSVKYGVKKFVMISTDKAVNPTNVMGCSKRICEIYCQSLNNSNFEIQNSKLLSTEDRNQKVQSNRTEFVTTRFGNVLGSNGSVIPLFEKQIKDGGPVTVTDPNIIRYFMLIPEACKLVLEAGTHGKGGQIFVFDMGKPVRIADLAQRMIKLSGANNVEIKYVGLRPGEKLYEEVLANDENTEPSFNKKIRIAKVRQYEYDDVEKSIEDLIRISQTFDDAAVVKKMMEIVPEYHPNNTQWSTLIQD